MPNIEKVLDMLVKTKGERLVISLSEPPYITKDKERFFLSTRAMTRQELDSFQNMIVTLLEGKAKIVYSNIPISVSKRDTSLEISVDSSPEEKAESTPTEATTNQTAERDFCIETMLKFMVEKGASDLHLSSGCKPTLRIDGEMAELTVSPDLNDAMLWEELKKITPETKIREFEETNDTDYAYEIRHVARFRCNVFRDNRGICAVFRQIPSYILKAEQLGVPKAIVDLCNRPKGLILVTGPTGCGKSTTLAALVDYINTNQ